MASGANYGPLRFGIRPTSVGGGGGQDWFYTTNVPAGDTNWVHLVMPLPSNNPDYTTSWGELLVGMDTTIGGWNGSGNSTLYIDNLFTRRAAGHGCGSATDGEYITFAPRLANLCRFRGEYL